MGLSAFLRSFIGAAPQSEVDSVRDSVRGVSDARAAADEMRSLVAEIRGTHVRSVEEVRAELGRLSARVEAMPEMRTQLEGFVQSLGRTMTGAADRLEVVDDRIERLEQQARAQTEIIALTRTELDRQGRAIAGVEAQMRALEEAATRLSAAADRATAAARADEERRARSMRSDGFNRIVIAILVLILIVAFIR